MLKKSQKVWRPKLAQMLRVHAQLRAKIDRDFRRLGFLQLTNEQLIRTARYLRYVEKSPKLAAYIRIVGALYELSGLLDVPGSNSYARLFLNAALKSRLYPSANVDVPAWRGEMSALMSSVETLRREGFRVELTFLPNRPRERAVRIEVVIPKK
jgi:hypothetical protein